jgi:branched-chain amino acid transport system permease protein
MARNALTAILLWVLVLLIPTFSFSDYHLFQLTMVVVYAIAILGLAILTGFNGQISLGHGAFYAIGAYVTAILMYQYNVPYWATLPVSAFVCGIVGFLIGLPALRLGGLYLALTTFALAVAVPQLLKHNALEPWTGGVQGLVIDKPDPPFGLDLSPDQWLYMFSLTTGALLFLLAWNIVRGRIGRAMMAIRDHSLAAEAMGIDIALLKTRTFALSALYTGVAGSLGAIVVQFVAPDSFGIFVSIYFFVGLVVGGVASIGGAIIGGAFIEYIPNLAESVSKAAPGAVYGIILILTMFLMPQGVAGFLRDEWRVLTGVADARLRRLDFLGRFLALNILLGLVAYFFAWNTLDVIAVPVLQAIAAVWFGARRAWDIGRPWWLGLGLAIPVLSIVPFTYLVLIPRQAGSPIFWESGGLLRFRREAKSGELRPATAGEPSAENVSGAAAMSRIAGPDARSQRSV